MTETPPAPARNGNGNGNPSVTGAIVALGRSLVTTLPPAFLMLVLMNIGFLALVMWFLDMNLEARNRMLDKILTSCLANLGPH